VLRTRNYQKYKKAQKYARALLVEKGCSLLNAWISPVSLRLSLRF